jgi:trehalose-6-phosphatase
MYWDRRVTLIFTGAGLENSSDVLPVYLGDDRTDEDAFKVSCVYLGDTRTDEDAFEVKVSYWRISISVGCYEEPALQKSSVSELFIDFYLSSFFR